MDLRYAPETKQIGTGGRVIASQLPANSAEFHKIDRIAELNLDALNIYDRYRGHPQLSSTAHQRLFKHELVSAVESGGACSTISSKHEIVAACAIKPLSWDTQHFGLSMAKLSLAAASGCPASALNNLLRDTLRVANQKDNSLHISCEVDIDDYLCLNTLLDLGAEILDIKREYRWTSLKGIKAPKFLSQVREYDSHDKPKVMQLAVHNNFESRFSRDTHLAAAKTRKLYQIWLEKLLDGNEANRIALVIEKNGRVQACGAIEQQDLNYAGVDVQTMSNGIYISSPDAIGSYYPIIYSLAEHALARFDSVQTCVSQNNRSASRVLERMNTGAESTRYALRLKL
tara:strand:- start:9262 stop:10290 length:1029 start_codon:yes stop_codon:yes gene_type:complete